MSLSVHEKSKSSSSSDSSHKTSSSETEHKSRPSQAEDKPKVGWNKVHAKDSFERDTRTDRRTERRPLRAETGSTLNKPAGGGGPGVDIDPRIKAERGLDVKVGQQSTGPNGSMNVTAVRYQPYYGGDKTVPDASMGKHNAYVRVVGPDGKEIPPADVEKYFDVRYTTYPGNPPTSASPKINDPMGVGQDSWVNSNNSGGPTPAYFDVPLQSGTAATIWVEPKDIPGNPYAGYGSQNVGPLGITGNEHVNYMVTFQVTPNAAAPSEPAAQAPVAPAVDPAANPPAAAAPQGQYVRVTNGPLNFREQPSTDPNNPPLTQIPQGAVVQVRPGVEPQNGFVPVTWNVNGEDKAGWIAQQFTEPAAPATASDQQAMASAQQNFVNQLDAEKQVSAFTLDENGNEILKQGDGVNANCGPSSVVMALRAQGLSLPAVPGIPSDGSNGAAVQAARYHMYQGVDGTRDGVVTDPNSPDAGIRYAPMEGPGNENSKFTGFDGFPSAVQAAGGVAETIPATSDGVAQAIREGKSVVVSGTFLDGATEKTDTWARASNATLHVVAVTGMTSDGNFIVSDPVQNGPIIATPAQLDAFMRSNAGAMSVDNPSGAGAPAATSPVTPTSPATAPAGDLRISNTNGANLRADPSTANDPKAILSFGDVVHPVPGSQPQNGFVEVTWTNRNGDELRGWVYQSLTESVAAGPAQAAPVNAVGAPPAGAGALDPTTVGYHLTPDALTNGDAEAQKAAALRDLDAAAQQGARSVTVVATSATDPAALKAVLDAAADKGIQVNVRVHAEGWKPTLPMKWDAASNTYQYDAAGGQKLKDTMNKLFTGLSDRQLGALGAVQLGNEPLDPKEWDGFAGEQWDGDPGNDGAEYQQKLAKKAAELGMSPEALAAQISNSMGLATRDMLVDVAPGLAPLLGGDRSKIATPAMGAGWTQYNNYAAQRNYFKGLMGMDQNNQVRGPSGLEYAGQVGMHAYVDMNANESQLDELTCLHAYEVALGEYAASAGRPAPGSETARPMFTEVGLDNRYGEGQGAQLAKVMMPRIDRWNESHPNATVADLSVWGWYPSYNLEPQWQVSDPALADSLRNENPH